MFIGTLKKQVLNRKVDQMPWLPSDRYPWPSLS